MKNCNSNIQRRHFDQAFIPENTSSQESLEVDDTSTSFSLQECIDEFRARRIRRVSTHSRDVVLEDVATTMYRTTASNAACNASDVGDADLINQNKSNKEQERKCKPCKNGFCYCFTSDSGDGDFHVRQTRRSRRSEHSPSTNTQSHRANCLASKISCQQPQRRSEPTNLKLTTKPYMHSKNVSSEDIFRGKTQQFSAVSSLKEAQSDAPLIHIIQELRDNCVISEVRVNKHKIQTKQEKNLCNESISAQKKIDSNTRADNCKSTAVPVNNFLPTAPVLSNISEDESINKSCIEEQSNTADSIENSVHSKKNNQHRRKAAGRLLKKRLAQTQINFKPRNATQPPPKPPRSSFGLEKKPSVSSFGSTSTSVREAEKVLDEFLLQRGVQLPVTKEVDLNETLPSRQRLTRKSYPLTKESYQLATCPSLSDIERVVASKRDINYMKNVQQTSNKIKLGWTEPKKIDALNYEASPEKVRPILRSQATQSEPEVSNIGWQPPPKMTLDTVDSAMCQNLATNMYKKTTPIKTQSLNNKSAKTQKFIWSEQLRNLSPWKQNNLPRKKSNLKTNSKNFFNNSKQKILRIVSPKKNNNITTRTTATQTYKPQPVIEPSELQQSPPGSYHSPIQSSQVNGQTMSSSEQTFNTDFDFSRQVKSPTEPKKKSRARKLDFPSVTGLDKNRMNTTYRSYHADLDQDVTHTKIGYLLHNIRAKLEASDDLAQRTFQEVDNRHQLAIGQDCPDNYQAPRLSPQKLRHALQSTETFFEESHLEQDPIYSEIEEPSLHISGSTHFDNKNEVLLSAVTCNVEDLYAKVVKPRKKSNVLPDVRTTEPTALGQLLHDSLKSKRASLEISPIELDSCSTVSYSTPPFETILDDGQNKHSNQTISLPNITTSLNNINEQNSPPQNQLQHARSNLSLQRSEIFLENLCRSDLMIECNSGPLERLVKVDNHRSNQLLAPVPATTENYAIDADTISYDLPLSCIDNHALGISAIDSPQNRSTPKKQSPIFTTKPTNVLSLEIKYSVPKYNFSNSYPNTPRKPTSSLTETNDSPCRRRRSLSELHFSTTENEHNQTNCVTSPGSALMRYKTIKSALRKSFRRGKQFIKLDKLKLSNSFHLPGRDALNQTKSDLDASFGINSNLDTLLQLPDTLSATEQLQQAVSICRQLPELEISAEMIEAERLLLYACLKDKTRQEFAMWRYAQEPLQTQQLCFIDGMRLPIKADVSQDLYFNYYYICTFEFDGCVKSTQSVECMDGQAIFQDCGIEFFAHTKPTDLTIKCKVFMLRLRKVSSLAIESPKPQSHVKASNYNTSPTHSTSSTTSSNSASITSRFRLHATFTLKASDLVPFQLVSCDTFSSDHLYLRVSNEWPLPLTMHTKTANIYDTIQLCGRVELRFPKQSYTGFLNVRDAKLLHNWNRRWCTLSGLKFSIWQDANDVTHEALSHLDLHLDISKGSFAELAAREICAKPRAFLLVTKLGDNLFCATDTQGELNDWLDQLNATLRFCQQWLA